MIDPGFEILNQRGTPMFFSDVFANRPTAGVVGRIFISTDTYAFYRDTGTTWDLIGGPGTGTITGSISAGQVAYGTAANTIGGSNNLYFDSASNRLGIGTTSPTATLSVVGTGQFSGNVTIVNNANVLTRLNVQNDTIGALSRAGIYLSSDIGSGNATFGKNSSGGTSYFTTSPTDTYIENSGYGDITIQNAVSGGRIKFSGGGSSTSQMTLFSTGNLGIGVGLTDGGQRLQVGGTLNVTGASTFGGNIDLNFNTTQAKFVITNSSNTSSTESFFQALTSGGISSIFGTYGPTKTAYKILGSGDAIIYKNTSGNDISILNDAATGAIKMAAGGSATAQLTLNSSGNLGLGVTPSAWAILRAIQVGLTGNLSGYISSTEGAFFSSNSFYNGGAFVYQVTGNATQYEQKSGRHIWSTAASGTAGTNISFTQALTLFATGNLAINSTSDSGQRLQVTGDTLLKGSGATSATNALVLQDSAGVGLYTFRNDGQLLGVIRNAQTEASLRFSQVTANNNAGTNIPLIWYENNSASQRAVMNGIWDSSNRAGFNYTHGQGSTGVSMLFNNPSNQTINGSTLTINETFNPTSGTAFRIFTNINPTINQTGGANGATIGLYVNPTLTAASDWRSIQWTNNSGWGLYGSGTAANFLSGNLLLGSATPFTANEKLQVTGTQQNKHAVTYSTGSIQSFRIQKDLTIGSGATISTASTLSNGIFTGDNVFGGSVSVPASSPFANIYAANYYQFSAAGVTVTQDQAAGGSRALSQYYAQNYFKGTNSGTITHMASMQIAGYYNNNTGSITPVITNAYQLLINDINEYAHTFTLTNRWGIYQEGASDRNYMAGKLMLNTTTDTGQRIQINGDIRIDGQTSGTAGGSSGQHLIINCDGTTYKIALLNN